MARTQVMVVGALVVGRSLVAQIDSATSKTFLTRRDAVVGGAFLVATAGLSVFDKRLGHFFQDTTLLHVRTGQRLDDIFTHVNETTLTVGGLLVYGVARLAKSRDVADVAFHATEAVVLASLSSQIIRGPLGRSRPRETQYGDQYDFHPFQGFGNFRYRAFPSIHSSSGFAAAAAIVAETQRRNPGATRYVAPIAYGLALTPGLARMYLGQHWASDIFAGAFIGTFAGQRIVKYSHSHPSTKTDRIFLGAANGMVQLSLEF